LCTVAYCPTQSGIYALASSTEEAQHKGLSEKGILPTHANVCSFFSSQIEELDHVLLNYHVSWCIWSNIADDLGLRIAQQPSFRQFYEAWMSIYTHNLVRKQLCIVAFFAVSWSLWMK